MNAFSNIVCPISNVKIDSHTSRLTLFLNAVLIGFYLFTGSFYFILLVAIDCGIRATLDANYSPLRRIAAKLISLTGLAKKLVDQAPKLFASRLGFLCAAISVMLVPVSGFASLCIAGMLLVFMILDSVFNFCVGCLIYNYAVLPFYQRRGNTIEEV